MPGPPVRLEDELEANVPQVGTLSQQDLLPDMPDIPQQNPLLQYAQQGPLSPDELSWLAGPPAEPVATDTLAPADYQALQQEQVAEATNEVARMEDTGTVVDSAGNVFGNGIGRVPQRRRGVTLEGAAYHEFPEAEEVRLNHGQSVVSWTDETGTHTAVGAYITPGGRSTSTLSQEVTISRAVDPALEQRLLERADELATNQAELMAGVLQNNAEQMRAIDATMQAAES